MIDAIMVPICDVDQICSDRPDDDPEHEGWYCIESISLPAPQQAMK